MKRWFGRAVIIVVVAGAVAMGLPALRELFAADSCLDSGGVYDYQRHGCRTDVQTLPAQRNAVLRRPDRGSALVGVAIALALTRLFTTIDRRRRSSGSAA
jgi:hypothetical protein